jgi:phosphate transport system substrate-binding protein
MRAEGSNTAPAALIEGTSNVAPMSRRMTVEETAAFRDARGYEPTAIRVGLDALAVFVNADNPIEGLSIGQVDAIFSKTRSCSGGFFADWENVERWSDVTFGDLGEMEIYGRDDLSGTHDFFVEVALCGGEFKDEVRELTGSPYEADKYRNDPDPERRYMWVMRGAYPLSRYLYLYVDRPPGSRPDQVLRQERDGLGRSIQ